MLGNEGRKADTIQDNHVLLVKEAEGAGGERGVVAHGSLGHFFCFVCRVMIFFGVGYVTHAAHTAYLVHVNVSC